MGKKMRKIGLKIGLVILVAGIMVLGYGGWCKKDTTDGSSPNLFESGRVVASPLPSPTSSPDSPDITSVIVDNNVVAPGGTINGTVTIEVPNANLTEMLCGEKGASTHNVFSIDGVYGLTSVTVDYSIQISSGVEEKVIKKCYFEVRDATGNISNYMLVQFVISSNSQYAVTAYGGDNPPNLQGTWDITHTVVECDPESGAFVGQEFYGTVLLVQTGNNVSYSTVTTTGSGIITGEGNFFSMIVTQTTDLSYMGDDATVTLLGSICGEMTSSTQFVGQTNSIVKGITGPDAPDVVVYPIKSSVTAVSGGGADDAWDPTDDTALNGTWLTPTTSSQPHGPHTLSSTDEYDWYRISMTAGRTYYFSSTYSGGTASSGGTGDSYAELFSDSAGSNWVAGGDDEGGNYQFSFSYTAASTQTYYLQVRTYTIGSDWSGNLNYYSSGSNNPPTVTITGGPSGTTPDNTPTFTWSGSDSDGTIAGYYYSIGDSTPNNWTTGTSYTSSTLTDGSYTFYVQAKDNDDALSSVASRSFTVSTGSTLNPFLAGSYDTPNYAHDVYVSGSYAYVADADSGLQIINVSNPGSPFLVGSYDTPGSAYGVYVSGSYAYVADYYLGLHIINISNPANPSLVGTYDTPGSARNVYISGSYAYVADGNSGLQIINVSNPGSPFLVGSYDTPGGSCDVCVSGSYAYVADDSSGMQIINVSDPASPSLASAYKHLGDGAVARGVCKPGMGYVYLAYTSSGLHIINIPNPGSPSLLSSYNEDSTDVYVSGSYAYVVNSSGLRIINISNLASPTLAGACDTSGSGNGIYVSAGYAYIADGFSGLQIIGGIE